MQTYLDNLRKKRKRLGFAPTMGALHQGHLHLIRLSKERNDCTLCSIFVNPTQFNDPSDLEKYPRTPGQDIRSLLGEEVDILFLPYAMEVYPPGLDTNLNLDFGGLDEVLEGAFRPGHFQGVAQVVHRLLKIVQPQELIMGQKDFQQTVIIRHMIEATGLEVELIVGETVREEDGLAMSSRNSRLTPELRAKAAEIYRNLEFARTNLGKMTIQEIKQQAQDRLAKVELRPEYFDIVNEKNLQSIAEFSPEVSAIAVTAVWAGDVRLIDNLPLSVVHPVK